MTTHVQRPFMGDTAMLVVGVHRFDKEGELWRLVAARDLPQHRVKAGTWGALLPHPEVVQGTAWVEPTVTVEGDTTVAGDAHVGGYCTLIDATISGTARVSGSVMVCGGVVAGNSVVAGSVQLVGEGLLLPSGAHITHDLHVLHHNLFQNPAEFPLVLYRTKGGGHRVTVRHWRGTLDQLLPAFDTATAPFADLSDTMTGMLKLGHRDHSRTLLRAELEAFVGLAEARLAMW